MTGFARADGAHGSTRWHWEVRSVNGRGLDLRLRLPPGYETIEPRAREAVGRALGRGSIGIVLNVQRDTAASQVRINEPVLRQALAALERIRALGDFERPRPDGVLSVRGVLELADGSETEGEMEAQLNAIMLTLSSAIAGVLDTRCAEGSRLASILVSLLNKIEQLTDRVAACPARSADAVRLRLKEQMARLMEGHRTLDETRLYQEAALLAQRADVEEEIKRLKAHVAAARELLVADGPVGRKLDFLAQEFNREANTLCSKSNDLEITQLGLELKATIDQMREQVQNIE